MPTIMISCGEPSGDLYAGALTRALHRLDPGACVFGFGGPRLREGGATLVGDYQGLTTTGLVEALRVIPRAYAMYRALLAAARRSRPDVLVLVDFPDFNFRLGRAVQKLGVPVVYYISPQLWAWRPGRLKTMQAFVARVLVIFPFERELYERAGIPVECVGHPLLDLVTVREERASLLQRAGLDPAAPTLALLPGSRPNELKAILPTLVAAARLIASRVPGVQFLVARAPALDDRLFAPLDRVAGTLRIRTFEDRTDDVLAASDAVVTASGTATVQTAIHQRPMVIVYRLSPLTYRLGKPFVTVDTYGMVNLVAGKRIAPELMQDEFTPERVADEAARLLTDPAAVATMRRELGEAVARLGGGGASDRAARAVLAEAARGV